MKKTLLTMLQLAVTIGLLWWVFHDPERRREMLGAVKLAPGLTCSDLLEGHPRHNCGARILASSPGDTGCPVVWSRT